MRCRQILFLGQSYVLQPGYFVKKTAEVFSTLVSRPKMCVGPGLKPATGVSSAAAAASGPVVSAESPVVSAAPRVVGQKLPVDDSISSPIEAIFSTVLDLPPSCVEFSPLSPELFVVGTYNLESEVAAQATDENGDREENDETPHSKTVQSRNGSLILFQISDETL